ncbi:hypothetical protein SAMN05880553_5341 [Bacillus toyonensis]|nr:hypothetical protein SAMN05880553_5341 [Bacillus toyonensis]
MKYIIDSVINYVEQEDTNYEILINGEWGCCALPIGKY